MKFSFSNNFKERKFWVDLPEKTPRTDSMGKNCYKGESKVVFSEKFGYFLLCYS